MKHNTHRKFFNTMIVISNRVVSLFMFIAMLVLLVFLGMIIWDMLTKASQLSFSSILHDVAFIIVLVKAYRILLYYFREHHVSIKYIVEISIIAPAIELIFAPMNQPLEVNILFAIFSLSNLALYLVFFDKLWKADEEECKESQHIDTGE